MRKSSDQHTLMRKIIETFPLFLHKLMHDFPFHETNLELNKTQQKALHFISYHKMANMGEICRHMNMEKGSFTTVVDGLIKKGLIERERDHSDRRRINLKMSEQGKKIVEDFERKMSSHLQRKIDKLSPEEQEKFFHAVDDLSSIVARF